MMNLRQGLFRAWVLISAVWIVCAIGYTLWFFRGTGPLSLYSWSFSAILIAMPPITLGLLGRILVWVVEGFYKTNRPDERH
jgi:hypothetical protein